MLLTLAGLIFWKAEACQNVIAQAPGDCWRCYGWHDDTDRAYRRRPHAVAEKTYAFLDCLVDLWFHVDDLCCSASEACFVVVDQI